MVWGSCKGHVRFSVCWRWCSNQYGISNLRLRAGCGTPRRTKEFLGPTRRALFFHVLSVRAAESTLGDHIHLLPPSQPIFVKEGQLNRITIYHYYPESGGNWSKAAIFAVAADSDPAIASFGGSEAQTISSDYDIVHFDFRIRRRLDQARLFSLLSTVRGALGWFVGCYHNSLHLWA